MSNVTLTRESAQQVLDALKSGMVNAYDPTSNVVRRSKPAIAILQAAIDTQPNESDDLTIAYMTGHAKGVEVGIKRVQQVPQARELTDEELREAFGKMYPNDLGLLELSENNRDFAIDAIGARHHWAAFKAGARTVLAAQKAKS